MNVRLGLAAMPLLLLAGCGVETVPTVATVTTIDRSCTIIERRMADDPDMAAKAKGRPIQSQRKGDCSDAPEWEKVKRTKSMRVEGEAEINFAYTGPDGKLHTGSYAVDGGDDDFYDVKSGDQIKLEVAKDDPTRYWRA